MAHKYIVSKTVNIDIIKSILIYLLIDCLASYWNKEQELLDNLKDLGVQFENTDNKALLSVAD
jgi:hypothetical protein